MKFLTVFSALVLASTTAIAQQKIASVQITCADVPYIQTKILRVSTVIQNPF